MKTAEDGEPRPGRVPPLPQLNTGSSTSKKIADRKSIPNTSPGSEEILTQNPPLMDRTVGRCARCRLRYLHPATNGPSCYVRLTDIAMKLLATRLLLATTLTFLHASHGVAQTDAPAAVPTADLQISAQLVLIDVSVESSKTGERIPNLTPADFLIEEDSAPQKITYLSEDRLPLSIVLMFDATDTEQPVLHALANGAAEVVAQLRPEDEVSVMVFSARARLLQDFTNDHDALIKAIEKSAHTHDRFTPTIISEDLFQAAVQAGRATIPDSRRAIIFLTDGTTNNAAMAETYRRKHPDPRIDHVRSMDEAMEEVQRSHATVNGLIDHSWMTFMLSSWRENNHLGRIAAAGPPTGGIFLPTPRKEAAQHLARLIDSLRHRYTIGYKPSSPQPSGSLCHIKVSLSPAFFARHITLAPDTVTLLSRDRYLR